MFAFRCSVRLGEILARRAKQKTRAGDETRTRDIQLGRLKLYQLSYSRFGGGGGI